MVNMYSVKDFILRFSSWWISHSVMYVLYIQLLLPELSDKDRSTTSMWNTNSLLFSRVASEGSSALSEPTAPDIQTDHTVTNMYK